MSIRKELFDKIESMPAQSDGWIVATTTEVAEAVQRDTNLVSKYLNSLQQTGNLEARKDETGKVEAFRILRAPRGYTKGGTRSRRSAQNPSNGQAPRRVFGRNMSTPHTDEYGRAKAAFEHSLPQFGQYVDAKWEGNPLAEEALALKQHNEALTSQLSALRAKEEAMSRELEYLRMSNNKELREGLAKAGVLVAHGD